MRDDDLITELDWHRHDRSASDLYTARVMATPDENRLVNLLGVQMLEKLKVNRHKNTEGNWLTLSRERLLELFEDECAELHDAAHPWRSKATAYEIAAECGDVANIVAMLLDLVDAEGGKK